MSHLAMIDDVDTVTIVLLHKEALNLGKISHFEKKKLICHFSIHNSK